jgi:hypothetical protein
MQHATQGWTGLTVRYADPVALLAAWGARSLHCLRLAVTALLNCSQRQWFCGDLQREPSKNMLSELRPEQQGLERL